MTESDCKSFALECWNLCADVVVHAKTQEEASRAFHKLDAKLRAAGMLPTNVKSTKGD